MKYKLAEDIKSTFTRGYIYGKKDEVVTAIAHDEYVVIVERRKGAFPVNINKLIQIKQSITNNGKS